MALSYISQTAGERFITGLSTDTKPASPGATWVFLEIDTGKVYRVVGGVWTEQNNTSYAVTSAVPNSMYRTVLECSASHIAAKVAGTYAMGQGDPLAISGTGTLYPINTIYIAGADFPTFNGLAPKLRIRAQLYTNDVAPTGNFTFGLYPITRPATSGAAGLCIYALGTVVSGSNGASFTTPAADGLLNAVSSDFALPSDGHYVLGVVTTATVATSALVQMSAQLQIRNN